MKRQVLTVPLRVGMAVLCLAVMAPGAETGALAIKNASATMIQTGESTWALSKTGQLDTVNSTVTWTINAAELPTPAVRLVVSGVMDIENSGQGAATLIDRHPCADFALTET